MELHDTNILFSKIKKETRAYRPLTVEWDITYRCPCHCVHCYQKNNRVDKELSAHEIYKIVDDLNMLGAFEYKISGGDPLVRKDIFEILSYISSKQAKIILYTSGDLLTEETCNNIAKAGVTSVETTILGLDPQTHNHLSNCPNSYEHIIKGVQTLKDLGVPVRLKFMLLHQNFAQLENLKQLSDHINLTIDPIPFLWCVQKEKEETILPFRLTYEEQKLYFKKYPVSPVKKSFISCNAGKYKIAISPDGHVKPCSSYTDEYSVGNLKNSSMIEIWNNSEKLKALRAKLRYPVGECRICPSSEFCVLCPAIASWAGQEITKPYRPMCQYAKAAESIYREKQDGKI